MTVRYPIKARFADKILAPDLALPKAAPEGVALVTLDDVPCVAHFLSTWDNSDGRYDDELDLLCQREWGCSFGVLRSVWIGRIDKVGNYWHLIELRKDDG